MSVLRRIGAVRAFMLIIAAASTLLLTASLFAISPSSSSFSSSSSGSDHGSLGSNHRHLEKPKYYYNKQQHPFTHPISKKEPLKIGDNEQCNKKLEDKIKNDNGETAKRGGGVKCNDFVHNGIERGRLRVQHHGPKHNKKHKRGLGAIANDKNDPNNDSKGVISIFCENGEKPKSLTSFNSTSGCHVERVEWLTYATTCAFGLNRLAAQLELAGIPLTVIGNGEIWRDFGYRMRMYHDHLILMDPKAIVFITDAEDVLLNPSCDAGSAIHKFLRRRIPTAPLVFSSEGPCYPKSELKPEYAHSTKVINVPEGVRNPRDSHHPRVKVPSFENVPLHKHVNGGTLLGRAGDLAEMIRRNYIDECYDDQLRFSEAYLNGDLFWVDDPNHSEMVHKVEKLMKDLYDLEKANGPNELGAPLDDRIEQAYLKLSKAVAQMDMTPANLRLQTGTNPHAQPPSRARPLVQLDYDTDMMAATYGIFRHNYTLFPVPTTSLLHKTGLDTDLARKVYRAAFFDDDVKVQDPLHIVMQYTHGEPCAIHQSGYKGDNAQLELLARDLGLPFSEEALKRAEREQRERIEKEKKEEEERRKKAEEEDELKKKAEGEIDN
ncbi:hypothetical protein HDU97_006139 [Phlyctochytrium planicorne]|nr:hypothetical protein HDU97_006139 [Phlyctochytrium planicorne]